jgi:hypothetical protein
MVRYVSRKGSQRAWRSAGRYHFSAERWHDRHSPKKGRHAPPTGRANARPMTGSGGASSTPRLIQSLASLEYWIARSRLRQGFAGLSV